MPWVSPEAGHGARATLAVAAMRRSAWRIQIGGSCIGAHAQTTLRAMAAAQ